MQDKPPNEAFLQRWSRLKTAKASEAEVPTPANETESATEAVVTEPVLTDADMPPLDSLDADSDYSGFLSSGVSEELRRLALRKLFQQPSFNCVDELDDYCEDFTQFAALGSILTADMKYRLEQDARQQWEALMEEHHTDAHTLHHAREQALSRLQGLPQAVTGEVGYQSQGRLLIIGDQHALLLAAQLPENLQPHILLTDAAAETPSSMAHILTPLAGRELQVQGYLGAFQITLSDGSAQGQLLSADLVLDLQTKPSIQRDILPVGYLSAAAEHASDAVAALAELVGEFSKPRYFHYDPSICAHSSSGLSGCQRCIEACPAEAIISIGEKIEVNPQLCQGGGACASTCPSGAIRYQYPAPALSVDQLRLLLRSYYEADGVVAKILFHRAELAVDLQQLPANILPLAVEELASASPELWLAALSFGASQVLLYDEEITPELSRQVLQQQVDIVQTQLQGLGYPREAVRYVQAGTPLAGLSPVAVMPLLHPATQAGMNNKRQQWMLALDHLYQEAPLQPPQITLPTGAPFGVLAVDKEACTLCMACATICPLNAIDSSGQQPQLRFHPSRCVQCGLCAQGCPEQALSLQALYIPSPQQRRQPQVLHQEEPFCCIRCGKAFGSKSAINMMLTKLAHHPMFQNERARKRLEMCEDCRAIDVAEDNAAMSHTLGGSLRH